ncbi:tetrahydrofolate dehydrogenase/cyclohydrolase catalytic domain-containing protein [Sanguibacter sp. 25GB23B1]|uniref:tetrahydrofolate dehydrogenase/cyclohydrolase catalytic domain-containing protein n=1 Tax=unclassified Sanguibacter TaxID=2645534 RepID=UPI0032AEB352
MSTHTSAPAPSETTAPPTVGTIFDGAAAQAELLEEARDLAARSRVVPRLVLVAIDSANPLLPVNVALHTKVLGAAGVDVSTTLLGPATTADELQATVAGIQADPTVDVLMVLLPLPEHLDVREVLSWIDPDREIEGLHPEHARGLLAVSLAGEQARRPVAAEAVMHVLGKLEVDLSDATVVVLVDADLMAQNPVAHLVARAAAPAALPVSTAVVLVPHTHPRAAEISRMADVLVVSVEQTRVVTGDWISPGAVVIDFNPVVVGTRPHPKDPTRTLPVIAGGVDVADVSAVASSLCAIPGGVGPVMLGILAREVVRTAVRRATAPAGASS